MPESPGRTKRDAFEWGSFLVTSLFTVALLAILLGSVFGWQEYLLLGSDVFLWAMMAFLVHCILIDKGVYGSVEGATVENMRLKVVGADDDER